MSNSMQIKLLVLARALCVAVIAGAMVFLVSVLIITATTEKMLDVQPVGKVVSVKAFPGSFGTRPTTQIQTESHSFIVGQNPVVPIGAQGYISTWQNPDMAWGKGRYFSWEGQRADERSLLICEPVCMP